jgi:Rrf2 family iron-sulfur cluster assembly transcriptional regulator
MHLTTKARYAVTALLDLALHGGEVVEPLQSPVSLADISRRQGISLSYLEQLFARLRRRGLVVSSRGPGGGYRLSQPAGEISIAAVADAMEENVDATRCQGKSNCQQGETCLTHHLWMDLNTHIHTFLDGVTLADLIVRQDVQRVASRQSDLDAVTSDVPSGQAK